MTNLQKLRVSLTKHGAYKVAPLLLKVGPEQVMDSLSGRIDGINIEEAQARKNLSAGGGDKLPPLWSEAVKLGPDAVNALVLIAIVFSHHSLIEAMQAGASSTRFVGRIDRGKVLSGKEYTNFSCNVDELGFATSVTTDSVSFDLSPIFAIPGLAALAKQLLEMKLISAGWDRKNSLLGEAQKLNLHRALALDAQAFTDWLDQGRPVSSESELLSKDEEFFTDREPAKKTKQFEFTSGHVKRAVLPIEKRASPKGKALRLHNDIQNKMYEYLVKKVGRENVGTELDTGCGTMVDVATRQRGRVTFYEIKTASTVRASIRQALPQLLEYCYWPSADRAVRLVIVSHLPITDDAREFLKHLRRRFGLPIRYRQFCMKSNRLRV